MAFSSARDSLAHVLRYPKDESGEPQGFVHPGRAACRPGWPDSVGKRVRCRRMSHPALAATAEFLELEVSIMRRPKTSSRATKRREMLRELAADEVVCVTLGPGHSRAAEAVDAMRRIQDGTYGICADCDQRIPAARLQAKPEAARCVACQTEYERRSPAGSGDWGDATRRSA